MPSELHRDTVKLGTLLSITEQIQTFGLGRKTGEIHITNVPPPARISIMEGAVVDAQFGMKSGLEAALALINLAEPQSEFTVGEKAERRTIDMPYMQILCEAALVHDATLPETDRLPEVGTKSISHPQLRVTLGEETLMFPLAVGTTRIGRATVNEIILSDATVSQRHACIEYAGEGVFLKDLGSSNGTYVAGQRITERWLNAQDSLQFGSVRCLFIAGVRKDLSE